MVSLIKNLYQRKTFNRMFLDDNVEKINLSDKILVDVGGG